MLIICTDFSVCIVSCQLLCNAHAPTYEKELAPNCFRCHKDNTHVDSAINSAGTVKCVFCCMDINYHLQKTVTKQKTQSRYKQNSIGIHEHSESEYPLASMKYNELSKVENCKYDKKSPGISSRQYNACLVNYNNTYQSMFSSS